MSLGAFAPSTGRQLGLHCGAGGAVEGEAGTLFTLRPPCWPAEAGGGPGDSTPLYRQNLLSTIWPLGRQVPAGRWAARNLQALRRGILAEKLQKEEGGAGPGRRVQLFHSNHCPPPTTLTESKQGLFGS